MHTLAIDIGTLLQRGGPIMWPLLVLSMISVATTLERTWFWARTHPLGWQDVIDATVTAIRDNKPTELTKGIYREIAQDAFAHPQSDSIVLELVERYRHRFERFSALHTAIVAAAPLLGILGTVIGIIQAFDLLGNEQSVQDVTAVAASIAEALITTGAGLLIALITLLPASVFRANANRAQSNVERIAAARMSTSDQSTPPASS